MIFSHKTITVQSQDQNPLAKDPGYRLSKTNPEQTKFTYIREKKEFILKRLGFLTLTVLCAISVVPVIIDPSCLKRLWTRGWTGQEKRIVIIANKVFQPEKKAQAPAAKPISEQEKNEINNKLAAIQGSRVADLKPLVTFITAKCTTENLMADDERSLFLKDVFSKKIYEIHASTLLYWLNRGDFGKLTNDQELTLRYFIFLEMKSMDSKTAELIDNASEKVQTFFYKIILESQLDVSDSLRLPLKDILAYAENVSDDDFKTAYFLKYINKYSPDQQSLYDYLIDPDYCGEYSQQKAKPLIEILNYLDQKKIDLNEIHVDVCRPYIPPSLEEIHALQMANPTILRFLNISISNIPKDATPEYLKALIALNPQEKKNIITIALTNRSESFNSPKSQQMLNISSTKYFYSNEKILFNTLSKLIHNLDFEGECFRFLETLEQHSLSTNDVKNDYMNERNTLVEQILYTINLPFTPENSNALVAFLRSYQIENNDNPYAEFLQKAKVFFEQRTKPEPTTQSQQ